MSTPKEELCGSCCKGSQPIRKRFNECNVCACGAPFFSQIVVENSLPNSRRCLIEIPTDFIEDHGHRFDKMDRNVIFEGEESGSKVYRVKIGGNNFVGFGFEWKDFALSHNIGVGQTVVFSLVRNSRFFVQIYNPLPVAPKVEHDDGDGEIEICVAQDWLAAKASRSSATDPALSSKVKVEQVFSQPSTEQATQVPEKDVGINAKEKQKSGIVSEVEADSDIIDKGHSVQPMIGNESPAPVNSATAERKESREEEKPSNSSDNEEMGNSDSSWSPSDSNGKGESSKRGVHSGTSSDSTDDYEPAVNDAERRRKQLLSQRNSKRKRVRPSKKESAYPNDEDGTSGSKSNLLVEGVLVRKNGHDWHEAGTKRGRTYVSRRRPATEAEKEKVLEKARRHVQITNPGFLKQLHKDSCYRALKLFPPEKFYREHMIPYSEGSYKATVEDENGDKWMTRILGRRICWKHFTLDHNLEEDDVVIFELMDSRKESVTFRVQIFRVVDIKKPLTGKAGWALHYNVVEGTKKQYIQEKRRLQKALGLKKQKQRLEERSSSSSESDTVPESRSMFRKQMEYIRSSRSLGKGKPLQKEGASGK